MREIENKTITNLDTGEPLMLEEAGQPSRPQTVAILIRAALRQSNYRGREADQFIAFGVDQRLGPHLKEGSTSNIVLEEEEYKLVASVCAAFDPFKSGLVYVPFLKQIKDCPERKPVAILPEK